MDRDNHMRSRNKMEGRCTVCVHNEININNTDVTVVPSSTAVGDSPSDILAGATGNGWHPDPTSPSNVHNITIQINTDDNNAEIRTLTFDVEDITAVEILVYNDGVLVKQEGPKIVTAPTATIETPLNVFGDEIVVRVTEDSSPDANPTVDNLQADACYHPIVTSTILSTVPTTASTTMFTGGSTTTVIISGKTSLTSTISSVPISTVPTTASTAQFTGGSTTTVIISGSTTPITWGEWSPWQSCSVTCGGGSRTRVRDCDNSPCTGVYTENEPCNPEECPTTPNWSTWTQWSGCDVLCGSGVQQRFRECNSPAPLPGQTGCLGQKVENITCEEAPCECVFDTTSFQDIFNYQPRDIVGYMEKDGVQGPTSEEELVRLGDSVGGDAIIYVDCNECICETGTFNCSMKTCENCTYTPWNEWTPCSKSCDVGQRSRSRSLLSGAQLQTCTEPRDETEDCNTDLCPGVEEWTTWSEWSECTTTTPCTVGTQTRTRDCSGANEDCGDGEPTETEPCGEPCDEPVANCTDGRVWADCAFVCPQSCFDYRQSDFCTPPDACEPGCKCPDGYVTGIDGNCVAQDTCPCYSDDGVAVWPNIQYTVPDEPCKLCMCSSDYTFTCEISPDCCAWDEWTNWGSCSVTCGDGTRNRYRNQTSGVNCGSNMETDDCNLGTCPPGCVINGTGYDYGEIITAKQCETCYCTVDSEYFCDNNTLAIIDGDWAQWTEWSQCSSSCEGGLRSRTRTCSDPLPQCDGAPCDGDNSEEELCNVDTPCCDTTSFGPWSDCSVDCGDGTKTRNRTYVDPASDLECNEDLTETEPCNYGDCNMTCVVTDWSDWSGCSATCGQGVMRRTRTIQQQADDCPEELVEDNICQREDCECEENLIWSNYSSCQRTCDERTGFFNMTACSEVTQGCVCPDGLYLDDNGVCVNTSDCDKCYINGTEYQAGETFDSPIDECYTCECVRGEHTCNPKCEVPTCASNEELSYEDDACCPVCKPVQDTCQKYTRTEILRDEASGCVSNDPVTIDYCSGGCGNSTSNTILMLSTSTEQTENDCRCCTAITGDLIEVPVTCNGVAQTAYIASIDQCTCNVCQSTESPTSRRR